MAFTTALPYLLFILGFRCFGPYKYNGTLSAYVLVYGNLVLLAVSYASMRVACKKTKALSLFTDRHGRRPGPRGLRFTQARHIQDLTLRRYTMVRAMCLPRFKSVILLVVSQGSSSRSFIQSYAHAFSPSGTTIFGSNRGMLPMTRSWCTTRTSILQLWPLPVWWFQH